MKIHYVKISAGPAAASSGPVGCGPRSLEPATSILKNYFIRATCLFHFWTFVTEEKH